MPTTTNPAMRLEWKLTARFCNPYFEPSCHTTSLTSLPPNCGNECLLCSTVTAEVSKGYPEKHIPGPFIVIVFSLSCMLVERLVKHQIRMVINSHRHHVNSTIPRKEGEQVLHKQLLFISPEYTFIQLTGNKTNIIA